MTKAAVQLLAVCAVALVGGSASAGDVTVALEPGEAADYASQGVPPLEIRDVAIAGTEDASPSPGTSLSLFGGQLNAWMVTLVFRGNVRPSRAFAFAFGTRVAW